MTIQYYWKCSECDELICDSKDFDYEVLYCELCKKHRKVTNVVVMPVYYWEDFKKVCSVAMDMATEHKKKADILDELISKDGLLDLTKIGEEKRNDQKHNWMHDLLIESIRVEINRRLEE